MSSSINFMCLGINYYPEGVSSDIIGPFNEQRKFSQALISVNEFYYEHQAVIYVQT